MRWLALPSGNFINLALIVHVQVWGDSASPTVALTVAGMGVAVIDTAGDTYTHEIRFTGPDARAIVTDLYRASGRNG